jgi:hypothetical protein
VNVPAKFTFGASVNIMLDAVMPVPLIWYKPLRLAALLSPSAYTYTLYPPAFAGNPATVTVVVPPAPVLSK